MYTPIFAVALMAGLLPALFWLWFWLREDKTHPEPKLLIALSFVAGMLIVGIVLPLQQFAITLFSGNTLILVWVIVEEVIKYSAALAVVLWNKAVDEPIDAIIYMIAIALGFSALENALYIFNVLEEGDYLTSILMGNFRFLGASLLHILASATVGVCMALAFYKNDVIKIIAATFGLFVAILLHALFNFFIMDASGERILGVFMFVWMGIILLFLIFEKIKLLDNIHHKHYDKKAIIP